MFGSPEPSGRHGTAGWVRPHGDEDRRADRARRSPDLTALFLLGHRFLVEIHVLAARSGATLAAVHSELAPRWASRKSRTACSARLHEMRNSTARYESEGTRVGCSTFLADMARTPRGGASAWLFVSGPAPAEICALPRPRALPISRPVAAGPAGELPRRYCGQVARRGAPGRMAAILLAASAPRGPQRTPFWTPFLPDAARQGGPTGPGPPLTAQIGRAHV